MKISKVLTFPNSKGVPDEALVIYDMGEGYELVFHFEEDSLAVEIYLVDEDGNDLAQEFTTASIEQVLDRFNIKNPLTS